MTRFDAGPLPSLEQQHRDPQRYPDGVAWLDGQYVPISQAKVSVLDWGFLHSDATYDTVHVWNGAFFRLDDHIARFRAGLERLRLQLPCDDTQLRTILHNCVALSGHREAYVEMLCTRGTSASFSRDPRDAQNRLMAFAIPLGSVANEEQMQRGLHLALSDIARIPPQSLDPAIKNYHWLDLVRGLYEAYDQGAENVLLRHINGTVAEGPGFNVFALVEGTVLTPDTGVLPGITRRTVLEICAEEAIPARAQPLSVAALKAADEVFITSTAGGVMPVSRLDGIPVGAGKPGPLTAAVTKRYWAWHADERFAEPVEYGR
ncbi:MAG: aminotransferase class IV [Salinarimonas sp.]|nr:aminotransferase class IV [Salinarimonas sp.]